MLTEEQILQLRQKVGIPEQGIATGPSQPSTPTVSQADTRIAKLRADSGFQEQSPNYFQRVGSDYMQAAKDITGGIQRGAELMASGKPVEGAVRSALGATGGFARAVFAPLTQALAPVLQPAIEKGVEATRQINPDLVAGGEKLLGDLEAWAGQHPDAAQNLKDLFDVGASVIGTPIANKASVAATKTAGGAFEAAGKVAKGAGERLYRVATPLEQSTARSLQAYQAGKPTLMERIGGFISGNKPDVGTAPVRESQTAARQGLAGTEWQLGVQAKRASEDIWGTTIEPSLKGDKKAVHMPSFFGKVKQRIVSETADLNRRNALLEGLEAMKEDFKKVSDVSISKLQDYKSDWATLVPERVYKGKPIAGAMNEVRNIAAQEARTMIYDRLGDNVKQAYLDYGNLKSISEAGIKSVDPLRSKGVTKQIWEAIVDKAITPVFSWGGKVVYKTGEGLEFIGDKGLKKVADILK